MRSRLPRNRIVLNVAAVADVWTREVMLECAEQLSELAMGMRKREQPSDADAQILDDVAVEMALRATAPGDWPEQVVSQRTVLKWAHLLSGAAHHLDTATDMHAVAALLRMFAEQLTKAAPGLLRSTGQWELPPAEEGVPAEIDPNAETKPFMRRDKLK